MAALISAALWHQERRRETYLQYQENAEQDRRNAADEIAAACEGMDSLAAADCMADKVEAYYREQAVNQDLRAQQDMAFWAEWMFYASVCTVGLTAFGIWLIYLNLGEARKVTAEAEKHTGAALQAVQEAENTTREAKRQADLQEEAFRRLERPYLFLEVVDTGPLLSPTRGWHPRVIYRLVNYGKTPAMMRRFLISLCPPPGPNEMELAARYEVLAPNGSLPDGSVSAVRSERDRGLTDEYRSSLRIYVWFMYEDVVGAVHYDQFTFATNNRGRTFHLIEQNRRTERPQDSQPSHD